MLTCARKFIHLIACRKAAAAVEFALVIPVFLMMLFGIISFGAYLTVVHGVQQLAAEATRAAVAGLSDDERVTLAQNNIASNVAAYPLITSGRLTLTRAATDPSSTTSPSRCATTLPTCSSSICRASCLRRRPWSCARPPFNAAAIE